MEPAEHEGAQRNLRRRLNENESAGFIQALLFLFCNFEKFKKKRKRRHSPTSSRTSMTLAALTLRGFLVCLWLRLPPVKLFLVWWMRSKAIRVIGAFAIS